MNFGNALNAPGGMSATFEEKIAGSPATVSIVIQGCMRGGTCDTLDTYTTVANANRPGSPITKLYDYFVVTPSWTGGTSPSVTVNYSSAASSLATSSGGASPAGSVNDVQINGGSGALGAVNTHSVPTGCVLTANNGAAPTCQNPALSDSGTTNSGVAYTLACPTSTTQNDNYHIHHFASGANTSPLLPDSTAAGCANSAFKIVVDSGGPFTFGRTNASDTFNVYTGSTPLLGQTSFQLSAGQWAVVNNGAANLWNVSVVSGSGVEVVTTCTGTVGSANATAYIYYPAQASPSTCTASNLGAGNTEIIVKNPAVARHLSASSGTACTSAGTAVKLYKNNTATALVAVLGTAASGTWVSDDSDSVSFNAGDTYSVRIVTGQATETCANLKAVFLWQ